MAIFFFSKSKKGFSQFVGALLMMVDVSTKQKAVTTVSIAWSESGHPVLVENVQNKGFEIVKDKANEFYLVDTAANEYTLLWNPHVHPFACVYAKLAGK
jgi:hypothetical protein